MLPAGRSLLGTCEDSPTGLLVPWPHRCDVFLFCSGNALVREMLSHRAGTIPTLASSFPSARGCPAYGLREAPPLPVRGTSWQTTQSRTRDLDLEPFRFDWEAERAADDRPVRAAAEEETSRSSAVLRHGFRDQMRDGSMLACRHLSERFVVALRYRKRLTITALGRAARARRRSSGPERAPRAAGWSTCPRRR